MSILSNIILDMFYEILSVFFQYFTHHFIIMQKPDRLNTNFNNKKYFHVLEKYDKRKS